MRGADDLAALQRIGHELAAIRVLLEAWLFPEVAPEPEPSAPPICMHPEESRADFGVTNGAPDWECLACGYRPQDETDVQTADSA